MDTPQHPIAPDAAPPQAPPEAAESFSGWLVSSVELLCGVTVTHLGIDATQPGWREVFGLTPILPP